MPYFSESWSCLELILSQFLDYAVSQNNFIFASLIFLLHVVCTSQDIAWIIVSKMTRCVRREVNTAQLNLKLFHAILLYCSNKRVRCIDTDKLDNFIRTNICSWWLIFIVVSKTYCIPLEELNQLPPDPHSHSWIWGGRAGESWEMWHRHRRNVF